MMEVNRAIILINKSGIQKENIILDKISEYGYNVITRKKIALTAAEIMEFFSINGLHSSKHASKEKLVDYIVLCVQKDSCFDDLKKISNSFPDCIYASRYMDKVHLEIKYFFPNLQANSFEQTSVKQIIPFLSTEVFPILIDGMLATEHHLNTVKTNNPIQILRAELILRNINKPLIHEPQSSFTYSDLK